MDSQRLDVPPGKIAAVVTYLEMRARPVDRPSPSDPWRHAWRLRSCPSPDLDWYRALYRRIGAEWLWFSRLVMAESDLAAALAATEVYVLENGTGEEIGLLELDRRQPGEVEVAFFGVVPEATGTGAGHYLMQEGLRLAWTKGVSRVWLHTCTLDHPAAVKFYVNSGFSPYKRTVEIDDDPRLLGALPMTAGRHAPPTPDPARNNTGEPQQ